MKEKKEKTPGFSDGYVSFTAEELESEKRPTNAEAYDWLKRAMTTSSNVTKKDKKGKVVEIDDVYPVTAEETEQMRQYLDNAESSATDPSDGYFAEKLAELRSIVAWSSERHYTYSKGLIIGVFIIVALVFFMNSGAGGNVESAKADLATVETWQQVADTTIVYGTVTKITYGDKFKDAKKFKHYKLYRAQSEAESSKEASLKYTQYADTAATADRKKSYLKSVKEYEQKFEEKSELYGEVNEMNYKEIHKMAKKEAKSSLSSARSAKRAAFIITTIFVLFIPLYIFSQRPYGYMITRMRFESAIVGGIQKFFFAIAGGMATLSAIVPDAPVTVTKWSDGTKTREQNSALSAALMSIKFMLLAMALCIFCGVSFVLMLYLTIQGLRRNYNWGEVRAQAQDYTQKAKAKIEQHKAEKSE